MDPYAVIAEYYPPHTKLTRILIDHSRRVTEKALQAAEHVPHLNPDLKFISEAAMLHDIGVRYTDAPIIHCRGAQPYVCHGIIGRRLLEAQGLPTHALVCERHVGAGISLEDIRNQKLPLPPRDMRPVSLEETIICYADKFFSKKNNQSEHTLSEVLADLARYGQEKVDRFLAWHQQFGH